MLRCNSVPLLGPGELLVPRRALGPVSDTIKTITVLELMHLHMDPEQPVAGLGDGLMIASLPDEAIDALVQTAGMSAGFRWLLSRCATYAASLAAATGPTAHSRRCRCRRDDAVQCTIDDGLIYAASMALDADRLLCVVMVPGGHNHDMACASSWPACTARSVFASSLARSIDSIAKIAIPRSASSGESSIGPLVTTCPASRKEA